MKEIVKRIMQLGLIWLMCLGLFSLQPAAASGGSEGNIDSTYKYAWSENSGWENFRPTYGGVTVHDTYLSGYAWAENIGWIKLGSTPSDGTYPNTTSTNWGVNRDGSKLSGYAWSENAGWINFNPSDSQVTISADTGKFDGYAWAENVGWIHFQNASPEYYVQAATSIGTVEGGSWSSTSTWDGGIIPGASQDVTISHDVTLDTTGNAKDLTIAADKKLTFSGTNQLTIAGNASITGTMDVAGGTCSAAGTTTVKTNGILKVGAGSYTANGTFNASSGSVTFTGAGTLNLAGAIGCGGLGTFAKATGCTVDYKLAGAQNVSAVDYHHLKLSGGGTKTLCGNLTGDNDIDGDLTIASGVTLDVTSANNYGIDISGDWTNSGTFNCRAGTVTFTGSDDSDLISGGSAFHTLVLNKDASNDKLSPQTNMLTVGNTLTITKGTFDLDTDDVNLSLGGALSIGANGRWDDSSSSEKTLTFTGTGCTITDESSPVQDLGYVKVGEILD